MTTPHYPLRRALPLALAAWALLGLSPQAAAETPVPTPAEVLTRAAAGRASYIEVLGDVQAAAPSLPSRETLYPYIDEMDQLQVIGLPYGLDTPTSGPLFEVAQDLTRAAIKFARLDQDPPAQIAAILKWAPDDVRFEIGQAQTSYLAVVSDPTRLLLWHVRIGETIDLLHALKAQSYAVTTFEYLQETTTKALVAQLPQLANVDVVRMVRSLRAPSAFEMFFTEIETRQLASTDPAYLRLTLSWVLIGGDELRVQPNVPLSLAQLPGGAAEQGTVKLFLLGEAPDPSVALQILGAMDLKQMVDYLSGLESATRGGIGPSQVEFLFLTLQAIAPKLEQAGLHQDLEALQALLNRVALLRAAGTGSFEGVFDVTLSGTPARLTIVDMGDSNFIMCLALNRSGVPIYFSLFNVAYNFRDGTYEAHRFAVDDPRYNMPNMPDWWLKFKIAGSAAGVTIDGTFSDTLSFQPLHAERKSGFNIDWGGPHALVDTISGGYAPEAPLPGYSAAYLTITQLGQKLAGSVWLDSGAVKIDLVYGYFNHERSLFRITSAELGSGRWVQVRGQIRGERVLVADYIEGGEGARYDSVTFNRVDN